MQQKEEYECMIVWDKILIFTDFCIVRYKESESQFLVKICR